MCYFPGLFVWGSPCGASYPRPGFKVDGLAAGNQQGMGKMFSGCPGWTRLLFLVFSSSGNGDIPC